MNLLKKNYYDLFLKVFLYSLLIIFLRIELIFSGSLPTGGDMGAHIVPTSYYSNELFRNFNLSGWSNDWFAGYPLYFFYFPLPAIIASIFDLILSFAVSFKLMVLFSQLLLVSSIEHLLRKKNEFSALGFLSGVVFLLTESFTIYGGNLASSLAGQYSFTYSLAFANFSIYFLKKQNTDFSLILSSIFFSWTLLSHIIPFIIYSPFFLYYFIKHKSEVSTKFVSYLIFIFLSLKFLFSLFFNLEFTTNMTYSPFTQISDLIKNDMFPFIFGAIIFILINIKKGEKVVFTFSLYLISTSLFLFFYVPEGALWNGRLIPFFNLGLIILFFQNFENYIELILKNVSNYLILPVTLFVINITLFFMYFEKWYEFYTIPTMTVILILFLITVFSFQDYKNLLLVSILTLVISTVSFLPHWINWNFTGYESKSSWNDIETLYEELQQLSPGRIMWEPNPDLNKYGTPMVLMTIPMFTDHSSVEGLYFDSSITTPYHFLTVSGLAEKPSNPVGGLSYINGNFDKGVRLMEELGVDYFIAYTDSIKEKALKSEKLELARSTDIFTVFSLKSEKVTLVDKELYIFKKEKFLDRVTSSVFKKTDKESFLDISFDAFLNESNFKIIENYVNESDETSEQSNLIVSDLKIDNSKIAFKTNQVNQLHLIKVSYFPNWRIINGEGPYRISPSFMAVIPHEQNVEIVFEHTPLERFVTVIAFTALFSAIFISYKKNIFEKKAKVV